MILKNVDTNLIPYIRESIRIGKYCSDVPMSYLDDCFAIISIERVIATSDIVQKYGVGNYFIVRVKWEVIGGCIIDNDIIIKEEDVISFSRDKKILSILK